MMRPIIRTLERRDIWNGLLTSLDSLRQASGIKKETADAVFEEIRANPNHVIAVAEMDGRIVGAATLLIEPKFIHDGGRAGHIEDVAVDDSFQGRGIGEAVIRHLLNVASEKGCYKTTLDCTDEVAPFYEKIGFRRNANGMRYDHS